MQDFTPFSDGRASSNQENEAARVEHGIERWVDFVPGHSALEHVAGDRNKAERDGQDKPIDGLAKEAAIVRLGDS